MSFALSTIVASDGTHLYPDSLVTTMTFNGPSGKVDTITLTNKQGISWTQTITYTGSNPTSFSLFVRN